jgi:B12-binding domain/radical SAM domain protein
MNLGGESSSGLTLLLNQAGRNVYALNVLAGAVADSPVAGRVEIALVPGVAGITAALTERRRRGGMVVVAWSFHSCDFRLRVGELQQLAAHQGDARVIHLAGGVHASACPQATLKAGFDYVCVGEGEKTIVGFLDRLVRGEDPALVRGIACLRNGTFRANGAGDRIDLDEFPPFAPRLGRFNPIELTRGCVYACKFCQTPFMFKGRFRHRSVAQVCQHVRTMMRHGLFDVRFITPSSLSYGATGTAVQLDKVEELLAAVRQTLGTKGRIFFGTFPSEVRPEHVTAQALRVLKRYVANASLLIGGQSGSDRVLSAARRGHLAGAVVRAARLAREAGFQPNIDLMFGLPGETPDDTQATLRLASLLAEFGARIHGHTFMPLPGTPYARESPGRLSQATARELGRLSASGKLYGQWRQQAATAQEIADMAAG